MWTLLAWAGSSPCSTRLISLRSKYRAASASVSNLNSTTRCGEAEKKLSYDVSSFSSFGCLNLRPQASVGAHVQLAVDLFSSLVAREQRADDRGDEAERHRDNAGVLQRKNRRGLDDVPHRRRRRVDAHHRWAEDDQDQRRQQADNHTDDHTSRIEAPPEQRQNDRW